MKSKQVLDVQQMQHLQELGLDTSNASAEYYRMSKKMDWFLVFGCRSKEELLDTEENIPAYTLQDVLDALPKYYHIAHIGWTKLSIRAHSIKEWEVGYVYELGKYAYGGRILGKELIDAAYELFCWCVEWGFVETNKNE